MKEKAQMAISTCSTLVAIRKCKLKPQRDVTTYPQELLKFVLSDNTMHFQKSRADGTVKHCGSGIICLNNFVKLEESIKAERMHSP